MFTPCSDSGLVSSDSHDLPIQVQEHWCNLGGRCLEVLDYSKKLYFNIDILSSSLTIQRKYNVINVFGKNHFLKFQQWFICVFSVVDIPDTRIGPRKIIISSFRGLIIVLWISNFNTNLQFRTDSYKYNLRT